jgi:pyruvate/2-oxoglutarate/acetoin dehydrogenase E1 component
MDMTFTQYINFKIKTEFAKYSNSVIFGQNIVAGSRISGLGAELENIEGATAINTTNSENSLMGFGFGLALSGMPSIFIMKQHDFALLGIDQLTNTINVLKEGRLSAPFIVLMVVVDSGYEGPQASLSSLDEFASMTRSPVHFLSTKESIDVAFKNAQEPGLHFLALSQRNMKMKLNSSLSKIIEFNEALLYQNINQGSNVKKIAIVFYGVNIAIAEEVKKGLDQIDYAADLIIMTKLAKQSFNSNLVSVLMGYDQIVILDTGKSEIHFSIELAWHLMHSGKKVVKFHRSSSNKWSEVNSDELEFNPRQIIELIQKGN